MILTHVSPALIGLLLLPFAIVLPDRNGSLVFFVVLLLALIDVLKPRTKAERLPFDWRWAAVLLPWPVWVIINSLIHDSAADLLMINVNLRSLSYLAPLLALLLLLAAPKKAAQATLAIPVAALLSGLTALVQISFLDAERAFGGTHPILFADISLMLACLSWTSQDYWPLKTARQRRWLASGAIIAAMLAIVLSGSRGCWVALPLIGLLLLHHRLRATPKRFISAVLLMLLTLASLYLVPQVKQRIDLGMQQAADFFAGKDFGSSVAARFTVWQITGSEMLPDAPFTGTGYQGFKPKLKEMAKSARINSKFNWISHPHNELLHVLAEQGIIGLLAFLILYIGSYQQIMQLAATSTQASSIKISTRLLFAGFIVFGLTDTMSGNLITHTFFCGMIAWLALIAADNKDPQQQR